MKEYDEVANSLSMMIIQKILILKYLYYYKFKEIRDILSNIITFYIVKSRYLSCVTNINKSIDTEEYKLFL